ncbi:MAG: FtsQ-type POTRA domain-containing protein [Gammaproteobacteria bacterium]|nr:FtsQ-type POTRA domain-containing protein [Gammaproteobacteria bacterium]
MSASSHNFRHNAPLVPSLPSAGRKAVYPVLLALGILALAYSVVVYLDDAVRFPVARVEVGGKAVFLSKPQLMQIVKKHTQKGFFGLNIEDVREEILSLPWIKSAYVRRVLPDRLHVDIEERTAMMQWNEHGLIDDSGDIFYPHQLSDANTDIAEWQARFAHLPHIRGAEERSDYLQQTFINYQRQLGDDVPELLGLYEDDRHSQTLLLAGRVIVRLGYEQLDQRLNRFRKLFSQYVPDTSAGNLQFDMRYPNGFTVASIGENSNSTTGYN